jgi:hypothetical protein
MPFDAVGFPIDQTATAPAAPTWSLRAFLRGLRDVTRRHQPDVTIAVLCEARALISEEAHWAQGVYERDGRRCAMGALQAVGRGYWRGVRRKAAVELLNVVRQQGYHSVEAMNDSLTHREVLAVFDGAIARLELGGGRGL